NSRDAFGCTYPQTGNIYRIRDRVSIESDDLKEVAGQEKAPNFRRAAVQDVKENALAFLHPDRFAMAEHATVDRKELVNDFVAARSPVNLCNVLRFFFQ